MVAPDRDVPAAWPRPGRDLSGTCRRPVRDLTRRLSAAARQPRLRIFVPPFRGDTMCSLPGRSASAAAAAIAASTRVSALTVSAKAMIVDPAPDRHAPIAPPLV